ncbi:hypothetical protein SS50377_26260 [Spironucleus salmonicida]|uniref:Uncharacterized protein n=1 Tax=Spironucleus salmonicida TaxID=348837 RepID=V6LU78_9EUKA|nr:hypothetical protein SS50377_26260 [Spironucleus salmonicida]|eukprot:EST44359.1 hypothetical protein SS50377_15787 [Spironucleus salmonicida]
MWTTRTERSSSYIKINKDTENIGPGSYKTNTSTLKASRYNGFAPFNSRSKKTSFLDAAVKRSQAVPPVGSYQPITAPTYLRGARPTNSFFCSATQRFVDVKSTAPGPGEYFQPQEIMEKQDTRPYQYIHLKDQIETVNSIPYNRPTLQKMDIESNERTQWISQTQNIHGPGPGFIAEKAEKIASDIVIVPVGGASTSLARVQHQMPWAKAPERMNAKPSILDQQRGPATYFIGRTQEPQCESSVFTSKTGRFDYIPDKSDVHGPGTYAVENYNSIQAKFYKQKQQQELQQEMRRRVEKIELLNSKLHPSIGPGAPVKQKLEGRQFFTPNELQMLQNPGVGDYTKEFVSNDFYGLNEKMLSQDAQNKLALKQTFQAQKWPETACSIPEKIITDGEEIPARNVQKPPQMSLISKQTDRFASAENASQLGPGSYDPASFYAAQRPKNFSQRPSNAFSSSYDRTDLYRHAIDSEKQELVTEQHKKRFFEEQGEKRQIGGNETAISFNRAKYSGANANLQFGSTIEKAQLNTLTAGRDLTVPGAGEYDVQNPQSRITTKINGQDRNQDYFGAIPDSLRAEIAGPASEKAANLMIQRRLAETGLGPGSYSKQGEVGKKSFNALSEDNMI